MAEKPETKALTAWLLLQLCKDRKFKSRFEIIMQTECFRESSCKHCRTAMLYIQKTLQLFWLPTLAVYGQSIAI